ncbi:MAG: DUF3037 domain-containing protein [Chloroflexota bacterium]
MGAEPFEYAVLRLVPRVERGERINVGVVLFCRTLQFLGTRIELDAPRRAAVLALAPQADIDAIVDHLRVIERIVQGDPSAGPIAALAAPERFRWVVSPSSTMIQPSAVHSGLSEDPAATLDQIFATQVA